MIVFIAGNDVLIDEAWLRTVLDSSYHSKIYRILPLLHGERLDTVGQLRYLAGHGIGTTAVSALLQGLALHSLTASVGAMVYWWTCEVASAHPTAIESCSKQNLQARCDVLQCRHLTVLCVVSFWSRSPK